MADGTFHTWFVNPKFYAPYVQDVLQLAIQHGIWEHSVKTANRLVSPPSNQPFEIDAFSVEQIKMEDLMFLFIIFSIGSSFAACVFVVEMLLGMRKSVD